MIGLAFASKKPRAVQKITMGFLSRLFGGSQSKSDSFVVQWAERRRNELPHEKKEVTLEDLFAVFVYYLATFAKPDPKRSRKHMRTFGRDFRADDSTLFELGCYMYSHFEIWLFSKRPRLCEMVSRVFRREFIRLFTRALQINNVADLFEQRVSKYRSLGCSKPDVKKSFFYLSQLIQRTQDQKPEPYDFDNEPVIIGGFFGVYFLESKLTAWVTAMLPAMVESMEKATEDLENLDDESLEGEEDDEGWDEEEEEYEDLDEDPWDDKG